MRNAAHGDSSRCSTRPRALRLRNEGGGIEITMSRLQDWLVEALNRENVTITAAAKRPGFSL